MPQLPIACEESQMSTSIEGRFASQFFKRLSLFTSPSRVVVAFKVDTPSLLIVVLLTLRKLLIPATHVAAFSSLVNDHGI